MGRRDAILNAAEKIIAEQGTEYLTLDAVALAAQVSKGGLLYHFPSRDALIEGLEKRVCEKMDDEIALLMTQEKGQGDAPTAGAWLRAYVRTCTTPSAHLDAVSRTMLGLSLTNVRYLALMQQSYSEWEKKAHSDGVSPPVADLVLMAADGCWLYGLFHDDNSGGGRLQTLQQTLLALIENDLNPNQ